ncbi:CN hydrolase domain containing protein, partial [Asbolus verrucosus]
ASKWEHLNLTVTALDYKPIENASLTKEERILAIAEDYVNRIQVDFLYLDLMVFPEYTLTIDRETAVEMELLDNPCDSEDSAIFIRKLSCAARNASSYVIVNLIQKVKCGATDEGENCQAYGYFFYNTDVVFGRNGEIVSLYHKYNLFGEEQLDKPPAPEEVVVETDFGINFGILTGFDILLKSPAQNLLEHQNVNAIVFSSMWYSELPFLTSLQTQQMWSYAHDTPLISAGASNPSAGNGGTGFYTGEEDITNAGFISGWGMTQICFYHQESWNWRRSGDTSTDFYAKTMEMFHLDIDPYVKEYNSTILDTSKMNFTGQVCYNNSGDDQICCDFTTKITTNPSTAEQNSYTYHMVAYSGTRSFNKFYNGGIEVCGIIACLNSSLSSCGQRFPNYDDVEWPIRFEQITIKATFENGENRTQYPNSLLSSIRPIEAARTKWEAKEVKIDGKNFTERTFSLIEPQDRLLTFAIYGRNFAQDSAVPNDSNNSASNWDNLNVTIAVVEYQPIFNESLTKDDKILANTAKYIALLDLVQDGLDIIIFPEATLFNDPETAVELTINDNPCDSKNNYEFIQQLSCAARNSSTYLLVNLVQKVKCESANQSENCQNTGYFFYNTNVVFDRDGKIVNIYHKYNLWGEAELDIPDAPEDVVIETDFGANFGTFICFDILFKSPAQDLLTLGVDAVLYPTMWFSELPFLTALQTQQMWSHAHNLKFFAAGANIPPMGTGGTGVYDGANGAVWDDIIAEGGSEVFIYKHRKGETPKAAPDEDTDALAKRMDSFHLVVDASVMDYQSAILDTSIENFNATVCYNSKEGDQFCCDFATKTTTTEPSVDKNSYTYHFVAFSGIRSYNGVRLGGAEICGIIACLNSSLSSANFDIDENKTQFPNSLLSSIRPIAAEGWDDLELAIAVVEYQPVSNETAKKDEIISANTDRYITLLDSINGTLDMIIFPEATLGNNPDTAVDLTIGDNPCDNNKTNPEFIQNLSCAARKHDTYMVVNLVQKVETKSTNQTENCQNADNCFYNTDVVFDKNGTIVYTYHKYNLFGEKELDKPPTAEDVVIETDFGAKFGIFTCFDILFKKPAQDLLSDKVDAIIYPTMWFSELPFLTSLQTQQMWSQAHNMRLFASGANNPSVGSGGTGIYDGEAGAVWEDIMPEGGFEVTVYRQTKTQKQTVKVTTENEEIDALAKKMDSFHLGVDASVKDYKNKVLNTSAEVSNDTVCYKSKEGKEFCCESTIKTTTAKANADKKSYTYHLVAYSGIRSYSGVYNGGIEICAIIACLDDSLSSCGQRFPNYDDVEWPITFEEISIKATFDVNDNKTQFPNSLLSSIRPIQANQTQWEAKKSNDSKTNENPAQDVLGKNIDAIIYFTMWHSDLLLLTVFQTQQMWARAHKIELFAAGANNPQLASAGVYNGEEENSR